MKEKNKYGQYFTIQSIARFMVDLIHHNHDARILEPSCGKGVFLDALTNAGFTNIDAYEIDRNIGNPYPCVKYESFISAPLNQYDVVIGNPPYIRWKNLEKEFCAKDIENLLQEDKSVPKRVAKNAHLILWILVRMGIIKETQKKGRSKFYTINQKI